MITKIIAVYLEETPQLIDAMKKGIDNNDWESLKTAAHSIRPSFSMMGINKKFETIAKEIQEHATLLHAKHSDASKSTLNELFLKIETVCTQACDELQKELSALSVN